jgi:hypothetical protein
MNRGPGLVFHFAAQSSFVLAVNGMWKLCKACWKSEMGIGSTKGSAEFETDF